MCHHTEIISALSAANMGIITRAFVYLTQIQTLSARRERRWSGKENDWRDLVEVCLAWAIGTSNIKVLTITEKQQDDNYHTSIYRSHNTSSSPASPSCSFPSRPGTVQQVARNLQSTKNIEVIPNFDEIESNYDEAFKPVTHKKKVYSEFVLNLIKSNDSEMTTKINHFKGRKTAIDMWEAVELEMKHSGITHCKALS